MKRRLQASSVVVGDAGARTTVLWDALEGFPGIEARLVPEIGPDEASLVQEVRDLCDRREFDLPPHAAMISQAMELLSDSKTEFEEIADVIKMDQVLASEVLKSVNEGCYDASSRIADLDLAVARLGRMPLRSVLLGVSMRITMRPPARASIAQGLCRHSVACSVAAREISEVTGVGSPQDAFLAGLIHDIGILAISDIIAQLEKRERVRLSEVAFNRLCKERHEEVGQTIADEWNLPEFVQDAIGHHHSTDIEVLSEGTLAPIALAELLCHGLALGVERRCIDLLSSAPVVAMNLTPGKAASALVAAEKAILTRLATLDQLCPSV